MQHIWVLLQPCYCGSAEELARPPSQLGAGQCCYAESILHRFLLVSWTNRSRSAANPVFLIMKLSSSLYHPRTVHSWKPLPFEDGTQLKMLLAVSICVLQNAFHLCFSCVFVWCWVPWDSPFLSSFLFGSVMSSGATFRLWWLKLLLVRFCLYAHQD